MTKTKNVLFALTPLVALIMTGIPLSAFALEPFVCDAHIEDQTINTEVIVPEGEICEFSNVTVNGNVNVQNNAEFNILFQSEINGNLSVKDATSIDVTELHLDGNISIFNTENVRISQATTIFGNVILKGNDYIYLFEQAIFGNVIIAQNEEVDAADVGISGNILLLGNALVNTSTDEDFYLAADNATCIQNEVFNGVVFVAGHNNGCPLPP